MRYFTELCDEEISGFGTVEVKPYGLLITGIEILKQEVGPAHATMDEDAMAEFLFEKTKNKEDLSKWRVWWHSHAKMQAFFSGTDTGTIDKSTEFPWLVSMVTNHEGELVGRVDIYTPIRAYEEVDIITLEEEDEALKELCQKEIDEKVTSKPTWGSKKGAGYSWPNDEDDGFKPKNLKDKDLPDSKAVRVWTREKGWQDVDDYTPE